MKTYTIVSTYPKKGSQNIGDALITKKVINAIKEVKGNDVIFNTIWRADTWDNIKEVVLSSDAIIFACLAIRSNICQSIYPYLKNILDSGIPFGFLSAGTSLSPLEESILDDIDDETIKVLTQAASKAIFFTNRGYLTQIFCDKHNLRSNFSGDIAFYNKKSLDLKFEPNKEIKRIAISDPHNPHYFLKPFDLLVKQLKEIYPNADIVVYIHGLNKDIIKYCVKNKLNYEEIYKDKDKGLDCYDKIDLHVGFRIHGHVSALSRRKYSYLLEQDGRGLDYGLTINRKVSVPSTLTYKIDKSVFYILNSIIGIFKSLFFNTKVSVFKIVNPHSVDCLISMIKLDNKNGFKKFNGLEIQLNSFVNNCLEELKKLP